MIPPDYLKISPSGALYVDIDLWVKSATREKNLRDADKLAQWLISKRDVKGDR